MTKNLSKLFISVQFFVLLTTIVPIRSFADEPAGGAPPVVAPGQPAAATATGTALAAPAPQQPSSAFSFLMFGGVALVMYFFMIRPQQKKLKEHQTMLGTLKDGDEVVTSSGIIGKIAGMNERVVTLEVASNVKLKILKSQVNQIVKGTIPEITA